MLPAEPLLMIACAPILAAPFREDRGGTRIGRAAAVVALLWYAAGTLAVAPRYLEYFNELAGGPRRGHEWLVDSNLDWGQDLTRLSEFMRARGLPRVHLAYFGRVNPIVYGIPFDTVTPVTRGIAVVSPTLVAGRPYPIWRSPRELGWAESGEYRWLLEHRPAARVGALMAYELR